MWEMSCDEYPVRTKQKKKCGEKEGRKLTTTTTKIMANFLQIYLSIHDTRIFPLTLSLIAWRSGLRAERVDGPGTILD